MSPVGLCSPPAFLSASSATMTISVHTAALFRQDGRLPGDLWLSSDRLHSDFHLGCVRLSACASVCVRAHLPIPCVPAPYLSFCFSLSHLAAVNCLAASGLPSPAEHLFHILFCRLTLSRFASHNRAHSLRWEPPSALLLPSCASAAKRCCGWKNIQPRLKVSAFRASHLNGSWFQDTV